MTRREEILRQRLLDTTFVAALDGDEVLILLPSKIARGFEAELQKAECSPSSPKPAIAGALPSDEIRANGKKKKIKRLLEEFIDSLPIE